jgi:WD40 repeat protein/tRNA A-37 threonylcarbamoyl transferase component Bud32
MSEQGAVPLGEPLPLPRRIDQVCNRFEAAWQTGTPRIEDFIEGWGEPERGALLRELVLIDLEYRRAQGEECRAEEYCARFPALDLSDADDDGPRRASPPAEELTVEVAASALPRPEAVPPLAALAAGMPQLFGDYELLEEIARGGMGVVYKARQKSLQRVVALKMILAAHLASPAEVQRFRAEAEAVASLDHPHIVPIYEVGECDGQYYFTMKLIEGGNLARQLAAGVHSPHAAAALTATVARAVHYAHQRGILHRDLKPANILLDSGGEPHVTDFGLARRLDGSARLTQPNAIVGTPAYMAPEQASGGGQQLTTAADVYALGAILYELLTGRPPFQAATPLDTVLQLLSDEPVPVRRLQPAVPRDLETVCHKCLEKDPTKRYASAEALAEDLRRFGQGEPVTARPVGVLGRSVRWARRHPAVAGLLVLVVAVAAMGLGGILWAYGQAVRQRDLARGESARADAKAEEARQREAQARQQEYVAQIGRADAQLQAGDHAGAHQVLHSAAVDLRGWEYAYLRRRTEGTPLTLRGHTNWVNSVAYSPDGTRLASASMDGTINIWDARTGAELLTLRGHTPQPATSVSYSPDGTRLASASVDTSQLGKLGEVKVWDANSGTELLSLRDAGGCVSYSPDGRRLASAANDDTIKVRDARSGAELLCLRGHTAPVLSVCYSPDGSRLASASEDKTVKIWDAKSGAKLAWLRDHTDKVTAVCYSPDGSRLASASHDGTVKVWDARTGAAVAILRGHAWPILSAVRYSPDGTRLASASWGGTVKVYDSRSGLEVATLRGPGGAVTSLSFSPDGTRLASASADRTIQLWDGRSGAEVGTRGGHTGPVTSVCYSPDGLRLASASHDKTIMVWDTRTGTEVATLRGHTQEVHAVVYSPDGTRLASASLDGTVKLWDTQSRRCLHTFEGHTHWVLSVCFSPDGTRLASAGGELGKSGEVKIWDARSGAAVPTLGGHTNIVFSVCYSPDGTRLASAARDNTIKLWDATSGAELATLRGHTSPVTWVSYSPDGSRLASASFDATVKLWDVQSRDEVATLHGHGNWVTAVRFSPDGRRLASLTQDGAVKFWDSHSGAELLSLRGSINTWTYPVSPLCFSPDGSRLASASWDRDRERAEVKVWDARLDADVTTLRGHAAWVASVDYSADGTRLVSRDMEGRTVVWDAANGRRLPDEPPPQQLVGNVSPDGKTVAVPEGNLVCLWQRPPSPFGYDPWPEDFDRRTALAPAWHAEDAAAAERRGDWFAAAFHWRQRTRLRPDDWPSHLRLAWAEWQLGRWQAALEICDRLIRLQLLGERKVP